MTERDYNGVEIKIWREMDFVGKTSSIRLKDTFVTREEFMDLAAEAWDRAYPSAKPQYEITISNEAGRRGVELKDALQKAFNRKERGQL